MISIRVDQLVEEKKTGRMLQEFLGFNQTAVYHRYLKASAITVGVWGVCVCTCLFFEKIC